MNYAELFGIAASICLLASISFKSTNIKTNILMRLLNIAGSILFVVYAVIIGAWSTGICNFLMIILNIFNIVKLKKTN